MAVKVSNRHQGQALFQTSDAQQLLLSKMRARLAGGSEVDVIIQTRQKIKVHKNAFGWFTKAGIAAIVFLGNLVYLEQSNSSTKVEQEKRAPKLESPTQSLSLDDQALFWTYALYDFQLLKTKFNVKQNVVINGHQAHSQLETLLPKTSPAIQSVIQNYLKTQNKKS